MMIDPTLALGDYYHLLIEEEIRSLQEEIQDADDRDRAEWEGMIHGQS